MNKLEPIEAIRECEASARLSGKLYSVCRHKGDLLVIPKVEALELKYEILETCRPLRQSN